MRFLVMLMMFPAVAQAAGWDRLDDKGILAALGGRVVVYDAYTRQAFGKAGDTQFFTERMGEGFWETRGGQYCSQWPPVATWTCYDVEVSGDQVRFINARGIISTGTFDN